MDILGILGLCFLAALVGFSVWALVGARGWKEKLKNLLIILLGMASGFAVALLITQSFRMTAFISLYLAIPFGAVAAFMCTIRNRDQAFLRAILARSTDPLAGRDEVKRA